MGHRVTEERAHAVRLAIAEIRKQWKETHGVDVTQTQLGEWFGVSQQSAGEFLKSGNVGHKLADGVAEHLNTTVDGLIKLYAKEWRDVRAGDIPGWREAVEKARHELGELDEQFYRAAADVVLPMAPRTATPAFAHDLARVLHTHVRASGAVRITSRPPAVSPRKH